MCHSQSGKIPFLFFLPHPGASRLQQEAWNAACVPQCSNSGLATPSRNHREPSLPFPAPFTVQRHCPLSRNIGVEAPEVGLQSAVDDLSEEMSTVELEHYTCSVNQC